MRYLTSRSVNFHLLIRSAIWTKRGIFTRLCTRIVSNRKMANARNGIANQANKMCLEQDFAGWGKLTPKKIFFCTDKTRQPKEMVENYLGFYHLLDLSNEKQGKLVILIHTCFKWSHSNAKYWSILLCQLLKCNSRPLVIQPKNMQQGSNNWKTQRTWSHKKATIWVTNFAKK